MKEEKFEVPIELDAAVMQYAAQKKFIVRHWYWSVPAKAAAVLLLGAGLALLHFASDSQDIRKTPIAENVQYENIDWEDFESKLEFVDSEIMAEAIYLAQL